MRLTVIFLTGFMLQSCTSNAATGVFAGGVLGAGIGALAANGTGALIGGAGGMLAGGMIGGALDQQDRNVMKKNSPRTVDRMDRCQPLTINDVIKLSQGGVSDDAILRYMKETFSSYDLSQTQVRRLQEAGVSQRVINEMGK
jgi:outer membrane lipoprotein SlyB